jgi:hypothetical protein
VVVWGTVEIDPTAIAAIELRMSLPIASAFAQTEDAGGVCVASTDTTVYRINAEVGGSGLVQFRGVPVTASNRAMSFIFGYRII